MATAIKARPRRTLVAGLGNLLLADDGVGVHAVRRLRRMLPMRVLRAEVGTAVLDALHLFDWADRIVAIDAMQAGSAPGTVYRFGIADLESGGPQASMHELGFLGAIRMLPSRAREIIIFGVEPARIDYGLHLSEPVQAAIPTLLSAVGAAVTGPRV